MTKLYLRLRWFMYTFQSTHPLVTPGVWVCGLLLLVMWLYNVASFVSSIYDKHDESPKIGQQVVKEFFYLPDSKGIVNLTLDVNKKDK